MTDGHYYFSNSFSNDLLRLESNELRGKDESEFRSGERSNFQILLPACGDLRHVVKTVRDSPTSFQGSLKFVINDIDAFVMARNVLFLFMMSTCEEARASSIATIWLSLLLPGDDFSFLKETLLRLINMDFGKFIEATNDVISVNATSWKCLRKVWVRWSQLICRIGEVGCIKLSEEKQESFAIDPGACLGFQGHLRDVPSQHFESIKKWFEDGVILSEDQLSSSISLTHYNPTFTGRNVPFSRFNKSFPSSNDDFRYCIRNDCMPYQLWDYLEMIRFKAVDSITVMCHEFTTYGISKAIDMFNAKRLQFDVCVDDFMNLRNEVNYHLLFDRIFCSNLMDYYHVSEVLGALEPLLSRRNPSAVLLVETFNWHRGLGDCVVMPTDPREFREVKARYCKDTNVQLNEPMVSFNKSMFYEYFNNVPHFISYLRGEKMADLKRQNPGIKELPCFSTVLNSQGLYLRDFRMTRNHVVPFNRRVNARTVNLLRGDVRMLEWYRKPQA